MNAEDSNDDNCRALSLGHGLVSRASGAEGHREEGRTCGIVPEDHADERRAHGRRWTARENTELKDAAAFLEIRINASRPAAVAMLALHV